MKLLKLLPVITIAGASASLVTPLVSCANDTVKVTLDESEKSKECAVLWRETEAAEGTKTTAVGIYNFELEGELKLGEFIIVSDIVFEKSDVVKDLTVDSFTGFSIVGKTLTVEVTFKAKQGKSIKVGDEFKFGFTLSTTNKQIQPTKFENLSLKMIETPCDIRGETLASTLQGTQKANETTVTLKDQFKIDKPSFDGSIYFYNNISVMNDAGTVAANTYKLSIPLGTVLECTPAADMGTLSFTAETDKAITDEDIADGITFTGKEVSDVPFVISVLFVPNNQKICPYVSTMYLTEESQIKQIQINVTRGA